MGIFCLAELTLMLTHTKTISEHSFFVWLLEERQSFTSFFLIQNLLMFPSPQASIYFAEESSFFVILSIYLLCIYIFYSLFLWLFNLNFLFFVFRHDHVLVGRSQSRSERIQIPHIRGDSLYFRSNLCAAFSPFCLCPPQYFNCFSNCWCMHHSDGPLLRFAHPYHCAAYLYFTILFTLHWNLHIAKRYRSFFLILEVQHLTYFPYHAFLLMYTVYVKSTQSSPVQSLIKLKVL